MALSDINEVIDRSIEKKLYEVALAEAYTPNRTTYTGDRPGYDTELGTIVGAKGFAIEIFGAASDDARDLKKVPRIIYDNRSFVSGDLGSDPMIYHVDQGATFDSIRNPPQSGNLRFSVTLTSKTSKQDRILHAIMAAAIPNRSYVPFYNNPSVDFLIRYVYTVHSPDLKEGLIEKIYFYEAIDLFESELTTVTTGVAKMTEITVLETDGNEIIKVT